jgi:hypothetical protein
VNGGKPGVKEEKNQEPRNQDAKEEPKSKNQKKSKASLEGFGFSFLMLIWLLVSWL